MILSGNAIARAVSLGTITIDPFDPAHINPASYDVTLGSEVATYDFPGIHDVKEQAFARRSLIGPHGFVVRPEIGYLMHTRERVHTTTLVPVLDGKSSLGRLFLSIHQTAGFGDPGFDGQYTLEVTSRYALRLYAGMRIAQMRFHTMAPGAPGPLYDGHYKGPLAVGPVPSRAHKRFL
jgi:dCTP deaminase